MNIVNDWLLLFFLVEHVKKRCGYTIISKFTKKREKLMVLGKCFDIQFPPPYFKFYGKYENYFKAEAIVYLC